MFDINKILETAPAKIAELSERAEESRFLWKTAEIQLQQVAANIYLSAKALSDKMTQGDLKATVDSSVELYEKRCECLMLESAYKKELIKMESWVNAFTAARKKASLQIEELRTLNDSVGIKTEKR